MSKLTIFVICIVALITGIVVYNKLIHPQFGPAIQASQKGKVLQVNGFIAQLRKLDNTILASGTLVASEDVDLHTQTSGTITYLNIREGEKVSKGTLLVKLFDDDLQAELKKLQAQRESAERTEDRLKQLLSMNGVGQQDYDNAATALKAAIADIDNTRAQIEKTEIHAPFDGVLGLRNVSIGAFVTSATTIASLQQIDPLKIDFSIPEKYASQIRNGDAVQFTVAGFSVSFSATVFAIEPQIETDTRTVKVRAMVKNAGARLFPGAFAKVEVALQSIDDAIMIPTQCVVPDIRSNYVVVARDGVAEFRTVETGIRGDSLIQIVKGLTAGDTVVTTALLTVKPKMALKIRAIDK